MKKKYIISIIAIILLLLIGGYLGYKIYYANYYDLSNIEGFEKYKDKFVIDEESVTITTITLPEEEYLVFKNMKVKNIFEGFESRFNSDEFEHPHDTDSIWYVLKDNKLDKQIAAVGFGRGPSIFEYYNNDAYVFGDSRITETINMAKLYEKYNITNDIELLKFIENTKNKKHSIFDSVNDMRNFYSIHLLNIVGYSNIEELKLIDGDYEGYMINHNMDGGYIKEYNILINGTRYCLTFVGLEYFTDEKIQDLLNTLVIE